MSGRNFRRLLQSQLTLVQIVLVTSSLVGLGRVVAAATTTAELGSESRELVHGCRRERDMVKLGARRWEILMEEERGVNGRCGLYK